MSVPATSSISSTASAPVISEFAELKPILLPQAVFEALMAQIEKLNLEELKAAKIAKGNSKVESAANKSGILKQNVEKTPEQTKPSAAASQKNEKETAAAAVTGDATKETVEISGMRLTLYVPKGNSEFRKILKQAFLILSNLEDIFQANIAAAQSMQTDKNNEFTSYSKLETVQKGLLSALQMTISKTQHAPKPPLIQAFAILNEFFSDPKLACNSFDSRGPRIKFRSKHFDEDWIDITAKLNTHLYSKLGLKTDGQIVSFSMEDFLDFGLENGNYVKNPLILSCLEWTFLKTKELRAKEFIFNPSTEIGKIEDNPLRQIVPLLKKWNYTAVPEPKKGDLVIYFNKDNLPQHAGYYFGNGLTESKLGILSPLSHQHKLFDVPFFESLDQDTIKVAFFRKG